MEQIVVCMLCVFDLVRCSQKSDFRGSVVSARDPNCKGPSFSPQIAGYSHEGY